MVTYFVVFAVLALILLPGFLLRPSHTGFFLAGRQAPAMTVAGSLLATCLGASACLGIVALSYSKGWFAFWWLGSGSLGLILLATFWVAPMRARKSTQTLPQWAGQTYGLPARILAAILIDIMWMAVVAAQWTAAGAVLSALFGWSITPGIVTAAATVTLYTAWGGQKAVLRTDLWQVALIVLAIVLPLAFLGRLSTLPITQQANVGVAIGHLSFSHWLALVTVIGGMYVVGPDLCSRILVAKSNSAARKGALLAGIALLPCSVALVTIGVALRNSGVMLENSRDALPWLLTQAEILPRWIGVLINLGLLAAMLSSADTCLMTAASVLELDVIGRKHSSKAQETFARGFVVIIGAAAAVIAIARPQIIPNMLLAYAFYSGGLLIPLLLLGFPRLAKRIPQPCIWTAMVVGGGTPVAILLSGKTADVAVAGGYGVLASLAIIIIGWCLRTPDQTVSDHKRVVAVLTLE